MSQFTYAPGYQPPAAKKPPPYGGGFVDGQGNLYPAPPGNTRQQGGGFAPTAPGGPAAGGYGQYRPGETLGDRCVSIINGGFRMLLGPSHTVARVDLVRPFRKKGPIISTGRENEEPVGQRNWSPGQFYGQPQPTAAPPAQGPPGSYYAGPQQPGAAYNGDGYTQFGAVAGGPGSWIQGLGAIQGRGARLKLMQVWDFPRETGESSLPGELTFGVGANFDMDRSALEPKMRIRAKHVALHLLPRPEVELRAKYALGYGALAVDLRYRVPVESAHKFWDASGGARLLINLFHPVGTGVHLTPGGLEFDERVLRLGEHTTLRAAATLDFPRRIPLDEQPVRIHMHRLGIKTRLL